MAGLSAVDLLQFVVDIVFLLVFLASAVKVTRTHLRADADVTLFFGVISAIIAESWVVGALGIIMSPVISAAVATMILGLPYLFLRLVEDFSRVPRLVTWGAVAGLILAAVALFGQRQPYPSWQVGLMVLYFVLLEIYAATAFVREARHSSGVTRRRMQAVALGSIFLGLDLIGAGLPVAFPDQAAIWRMLSEVATLVSGLAYYAGFAPPGWLRNAWQAPELRAAGRRSSELVRLPELALAVKAMEHDCAVALGGHLAVIWLWDPVDDTLHSDWNGAPLTIPVRETVCGQALITQKGLFVDDVPSASPRLAEVYRKNNVNAGLIAPITIGKRRFGVVAVYAERPPIFAVDDIEVIQLLADQMAVVLENRLLVEETARERARSEALAAVEQVNAELEQRIRERTVELQEALRELETFSYSVSHDLRAPLRSIDGFVQAFVKDFGRQVSPTGQDYLDRIRAASQRMGMLIDGLLRLSRVTRSELRHDVVDLSALARGIVADLRKRDPDRAVAVDIGTGLVVEGDEQLLRVALDNLIENAWKFTSRRADARIAFGVTRLESGEAYFIRDNGAGFDMEYADKLFIPFERLHGRTEFDGMGIGLATVQRIVRRHGGKIWGEGKPDQGATFYFTLGYRYTVDGGEKTGGTIWESAEKQAHLTGRG